MHHELTTFIKFNKQRITSHQKTEVLSA